jgi:hypothetical protein
MNNKLRAGLLVAGILPACASLVGADFDKVHLARGGEAAVDVGGTHGDAGQVDNEAGRADAPTLQGGGGGEPGLPLAADGGTSGEGAAVGAAGAAGLAGGGGDFSGSSSCPVGQGFVDVSSLPAPANGGPLPQVLASGVARLDRAEADEPCQAVLLGTEYILAIDCAPVAQDTVVFGTFIFPGAGLPGSTFTYRVDKVDRGERFSEATVVVDPFTWATLRLPFEARDPAPQELLTVVTHRGDGLARAARVTLDAELFNRESPPVDTPSDMSSIFNSDGRLIGFCAFDECVRPRNCISMSRLIAAAPALRTRYAMRGLFLGDATGDGKADFTAITAQGVGLLRSTGSALGPLEWWDSFPYFGQRQNLLADFDGDGRVDLAIVNDVGFAVRKSNGTEYGSQSSYFTPQMWGHWGTQAGDVDGKNGADFAIVEVDHVRVHRSTGSGFGAAENWGSIETEGLLQVELTDLTHDGRADLVEIYGDRIAVAVSTGEQFDEPSVWLRAATPAGGYFLADITGDGAADVIHLERGHIKVFAAASDGFAALKDGFQTVPPVGDRANYFADATGDGRADAIAVDNDGVLVSPSTGADFLAPQVWIDQPFYGGI